MSEKTTLILKFLLPSLAGVFFFLLPVQFEGTYTIPIGVLSGVLTGWLAEQMTLMVLAIVSIAALGSLWYSQVRPMGSKDANLFQRQFIVTKIWLILRVLGMVFTYLIYFQAGPEFIWAKSTGGTVLNDLATSIVIIFVFASFALPLLTDYGLLELVGTVLTRIFRFLFRLPGRACIDALASWMAAAPVGLLITTRQLENGYYSAREATVIATNFSVVSLPFCLLVAEFTQMEHLFIQYYLTVVAAGLVAAVIMPRIPPLSRKPDQYIDGSDGPGPEEAPGTNLIKVGMEKALAKASAAPGVKKFLSMSTENLLEIWIGLLSPLMFIATFGLILVEYTPLFHWLSAPLVPLLEWLDIEEASAAAPAFLAGFAEMFLPAIIANGIENEMTKFIIICVSITQLIYMSEVGILILKTSIPLNFIDLVVVFLLRTTITFPVVLLITRYIVF